MDVPKFYKVTALPASPTSSDDGVYFVRPNSSVGYIAWIITNGIAVQQDAVTTAALLAITGVLSNLTTSVKTNLVAAINEVNGKVSGDLVPYTGANKTINFNTQTFILGGTFRKDVNTFDWVNLGTGTAASDLLRKYHNVASYIGSRASTNDGVIRVVIPINASSMWNAQISIQEYTGVSTSDPRRRTKLTVGAYSTGNAASFVLCENPDRISKVAFGRDSNGNTVLLIYPSGPLAFEEVVIDWVQQAHGYASALETKSNYAVNFVATADIPSLNFILNNEVLNAGFQRDSFYASKIWAGDNFHKLAKNLTEATSGPYYISTPGIEANDILGNVSTYMNSGTIAGTAYTAQHILSYGVNANYGYHLYKHASSNSPLRLRARVNGVWQSEETFAYQSWVSSTLGTYVLQTSLNAQLANYATLAGTQTFSGTNTFNQAPVVPAGTINSHTVNLGQVNSLLNNKVDKVAGKQLSTEDYTTVEKTKLSGIQDGAEVNVNADWNATSGDGQILNKPTIPTVNNPTITFLSTGAMTGGGTITLNQSGPATIPFDLLPAVKTDIQSGAAIAAIFNQIQQYHQYHDRSSGGSVNPTGVLFTVVGTPGGPVIGIDIYDHNFHGAEVVLQGPLSGYTDYNINAVNRANTPQTTIRVEAIAVRVAWDSNRGAYRIL